MHQSAFLLCCILETTSSEFHNSLIFESLTIRITYFVFVLFSTCQLLFLSNTMAADIKTIKEEITTLKSKCGEGRKGASGSSNSSTCKDSDIESIESAAVPAAPELDTEGYLAVLRRAFRVVLNGRQATASTVTASASATSSGALVEGEDKSTTSSDIANDEALKKGCQALSMYAKKVLDNPTQPRYRKIAMSNASFKNLVQPLKGHIEVLSAIGFIATVTATPCFEWTWYFELSEEDKSKTATTVKRVDKPDASGVKDILKECIRFLDICTTQGLSSLEKELDRFDVVPAVVDATKGGDDKIVSSAADSGETLLNVKETVTGSSSSGSSSSSSSSREKHAGTDNEGGSDATANTSKSVEKSSNADAEFNTESNSTVAEKSIACAIGKVSDTPSDEIPVSVAPPISAESPSLLFSDVSK
jgi:PUB domain